MQEGEVVISCCWGGGGWRHLPCIPLIHKLNTKHKNVSLSFEEKETHKKIFFTFFFCFKFQNWFNLTIATYQQEQTVSLSLARISKIKKTITFNYKFSNCFLVRNLLLSCCDKLFGWMASPSPYPHSHKKKHFLRAKRKKHTFLYVFTFFLF